MTARITEIINRIYEAEGLLELARRRSDKLADLLPLLKERINDVQDLIAKLEPESIVSAPQDDAVKEGCAGEDKTRQEDAMEDEETEVYELPDETPHQADAISQPAGADSGTRAKNVRDNAPVFCLNDRFRFIRAIFGGSQAEFDKAMSVVAAADGYGEAEEYFFGELGFDPEMPEVVEFMDIIKSYYGL